jgi:hypothetical protein
MLVMKRIESSVIEQKLINDLSQVFDTVLIDYDNTYDFGKVYIQNINFVRCGEFITVTFTLLTSKSNVKKPLGFLMESLIYGIENRLFWGYSMQGTETESVQNDIVFVSQNCTWNGEIEEILTKEGQKIQIINVNKEEVKK